VLFTRQACSLFAQGPVWPGLALTLPCLRGRWFEWPARHACEDAPVSPKLDLDLPAIALAHLSSRGAARTGPRADAEATATLLAGRGYPAYPALLAFETAYGGLQLFESDPTAAVLVVGSYACFRALPKYTGHQREGAGVAAQGRATEGARP